VRARLTVAVSLLVALALGAAGLIVFAVQGDRTQERITLEVEQELAEFTRLQSRGIDPATGEPFTDVPSLVTTFLRRNVPDQGELIRLVEQRSPPAAPGVPRSHR